MSDPGAASVPERGADEDRDGAARAEPRVAAERLLDMFVFAPAELAMSTLREFEHFDEIAAKGRKRFGTQVSNARFIGQLVVGTGRRQLERLIGAMVSHDGAAPDESPTFDGHGDVAPAPPRSAVPDGAEADGAEADLAIPDYRALSASQVVRRLDGLGRDELEALYRYEASTRGRRTILHRAQQLLGHEEPPVPSAPD